MPNEARVGEANGRVYDPLTAQFFSPDPTTTDAGNWLDYNKYSYCLNNPFRYTDPSGYTWWAENWKPIATTASSILVGGVVSIVTLGAGTPVVLSGMMAGAAGGFASGTVGTALYGGSFSQSMSVGIKGAVVGSFVGGLTAGIGEQFGGLGSVWNELGRAGAHAVVQGGFSAINGGNFWQGAAAGFVSSFAGSFSQGFGIHGWGMVGISAASGGIGVAIAGGKAEDILFGMLQGAMVGTLNHLAHESVEKKNQVIVKKTQTIINHPKIEVESYTTGIQQEGNPNVSAIIDANTGKLIEIQTKQGTIGTDGSYTVSVGPVQVGTDGLNYILGFTE